MRLSLVRHPDASCAAVSAIAADVTRNADGGMTMKYRVEGSIAEFVLADAGSTQRSHHLWRHTCFEVFVRLAGDACYQEFNFAPSSHWAAYGFTGRRSGMHDLELDNAPHIVATTDGDDFVLTATVPELALPHERPWEIGLSVIIEESAGNLSFWALAHPPGAADFHHNDCFAFTLAPLDPCS